MGLTQNVDTSTFENAMKDDYYKDIITSQLNDKQKLVSIFTKDIEGFDSGGNQLVASIKTNRNYAVRSVTDGGMLPNPRSPQYKKLYVPKRYTYGSVQITGPVMKQSLKSAASFGRALEDVTQDLVESIDRFRNRVLCGYGRGILALVNGAGSGSATINVDSPGGFSGSVNGPRFLNEGMEVAICDSSTGAILAVRLVDSFDTSANTVTFTQPVSAGEAPDNSLIVLGTTNGTDVESSLDIEPMGVMGIIDDGTFVNDYFGNLRSSVQILKSTVIPTVGVLTAMKLQRGLDATDRKSGYTPDIYLMDHSVRREYLGIREADFRYLDDKMTPDVGFDGGALNGEIKYTKTRIIPIKDFAYGYWVGVYKPMMVRTVDSEGEWINEDGAILSRIPNRDVFLANYRIFENFWSRQPNSGFRLDGITATIDPDHIF